MKTSLQAIEAEQSSSKGWKLFLKANLEGHNLQNNCIFCILVKDRLCWHRSRIINDSNVLSSYDGPHVYDSYADHEDPLEEPLLNAEYPQITALWKPFSSV